MKLVVTIKKF